MKLTTYLNFPGNCEEALHFYEKQLDAKILMLGRFSDMSSMGAPQNLPPGLSPNGILHARFKIGDTLVMASDGPPDQCLPMRSAYLAVSVDSNEEAERIYKALSDDGEIFMPMSETFFANRFGQFRDKYGVNWMVIHEKPMPRNS